MTHGIQLAIAAALGLGAAPALAERLDLDHRLYPPLHEAMEHQTDQTVYFRADRSGAMFDRILVEGNSAESDWTEALELLVTPRSAKARTPEEWYRAFRPGRESACPGKVTPLAQDETSLTFALDAPACASSPALTGVYRVVYGRKSVYLVAAKRKGGASPAQRDQWLALLASAKLAG